MQKAFHKGSYEGVVIYLQSLSSVGCSSLVWDVTNSMLHLCLGGIRIQIKLTVGSVTENFRTNLYLVWPNIKVIGQIFDEGQHRIVVVLSNTAGRIDDEDNVSFSLANWYALVLWF